MAPNLLLKPTYFRGDSDSINKINDVQCSKDTVRTEFIVQNIYSHLLRYEYDFPEISAQSEAERDAINIWKRDVDDFKSIYLEDLFRMCADINITASNARDVLNGVANELFCEGITWSRIMSLFVFTTVFCSQCLGKNLPQDIVAVIFKWLREYVTKSLEKWVSDHGGWNEIVSPENNKDGRSTESQQSNGIQSTNERNSWAKSVLHGTVKFIGTLAHIANATGQTISHPIND